MTMPLLVAVYQVPNEHVLHEVRDCMRPGFIPREPPPVDNHPVVVSPWKAHIDTPPAQRLERSEDGSTPLSVAHVCHAIGTLRWLLQACGHSLSHRRAWRLVCDRARDTQSHVRTEEDRHETHSDKERRKQHEHAGFCSSTP